MDLCACVRVCVCVCVVPRALLKEEVTAVAQWAGSMEEEETGAPLPPASLQSTETGEETWAPGAR